MRIQRPCWFPTTPRWHGSRHAGAGAGVTNQSPRRCPIRPRGPTMSTYRRSTRRFEEYVPSCSAKTVRFFLYFYLRIASASAIIIRLMSIVFTFLQEANLGNRSPACATGTVRLFYSSFVPSFVARTGNWTDDTFVYYRNVRW